MNHSITKAQFDLQRSWFTNSLADISEKESNIRIADNLNPIKWVAGHVLNTRMSLLSILSGNPQDPDYSKLFGKGSSNKLDSSFPSIEEIKLKWNSVSVELTNYISGLTEDKLLSPPPFQTAIANNTLQGLIAYMVIHESHHIGQLSILRKLLGKTAMSMSRQVLI
jgi:uncharacterized damage-inducible protein DinB